MKRRTSVALFLVVLCGCGTKKVPLFSFADIEWNHEVNLRQEHRTKSKQMMDCGYLRFDEEKYADAENCFKRLIDDPDHCAEAETMLGIIATKRGWHDLAEKHFANAIEKDPNHRFAYVAYTWSLCEDERYNDAERIAQELCDTNAGDSTAWKVLDEVRNRHASARFWRGFWRATIFLLAVVAVGALVTALFMKFAWPSIELELRKRNQIEQMERRADNEIANKQAEAIQSLTLARVDKIVTQVNTEIELFKNDSIRGAIRKAAVHYENQLHKLNELRMSAAEKNKRRQELEQQLCERVSHLVSMTE